MSPGPTRQVRVKAKFVRREDRVVGLGPDHEDVETLFGMKERSHARPSATSRGHLLALTVG